MIGMPANCRELNTQHASLQLLPVTRAKLNANIQVWIVPFALLRTQACQFHRLSPEEHLRASKMKGPQGARNYSLVRTFLRSILALQMNRFPSDVNIQYSVNGKPFVSDGPAFNLSHCRKLLVLAVADNDFSGQIGVDVEARVNDADRLRLAEKCFTQSERIQLATFPAGTSRENAFTRGWTRKEAVIKAIGTGLQTPLHKFDVSLKADEAHAKGIASNQFGLRSKEQSLLLASQLEDASLKNCEIFDLAPRLDCELSLAVIHNAVASINSIQVHDVDECQLNAVVDFDHE